MPRKNVIVLVGVILAILTLSFFATGYDLGGKTLVIYEARDEYDFHLRINGDRYKLHYDSSSGEICMMSISGTFRENSTFLENLTTTTEEAFRRQSHLWIHDYQRPQESQKEPIITRYKVFGEYYYVEIPAKYLKWDYSERVEGRDLTLTQGDFYLFSILCLIGMCFLAIYVAFTSRKE